MTGICMGGLYIVLLGVDIHEFHEDTARSSEDGMAQRVVVNSSNSIHSLVKPYGMQTPRHHNTTIACLNREWRFEALE